MAATVTLSAITAATAVGATRPLAAAGCFTAMLALTIAGNMPINLAVLRWQEPGDPERWRKLRCPFRVAVPQLEAGVLADPPGDLRQVVGDDCGL